MANLVVRKVHNGRVKINGKWYRPTEHHMPYDGRCDGTRFRFGVYSPPFDAVSLHSVAGTDETNCQGGPHNVDGHFPWEWWIEEVAGG